MTSLNILKRALGQAACIVLATTLLVSCAAQRGTLPDPFTLSILGTNDVHGQLLPAADRGGLVAISAYVDALRDTRRQDSGALLVIGAGDMWQGTLESNLVEGANVVEAYNAIGYTAATIGNHEFDFGPIGEKATSTDDDDDPRGALKRRLAEAEFPILAANLIDEKTGRPVEWENVRPSRMFDVNGVKVGVVGVITEHALQVTISANTIGLRIAPLMETITREATLLRNQGASIVVVTAHAGSTCTEFNDPMDLSSCNLAGEIMRAAAALPTGLVDHIIGGHVHKGIAHIVNGISITSSYSNARAFSRVDLIVDRNTGHIISRHVHPPHWACLSISRITGACASPDDDPMNVRNAVYEGRQIEPMPEVQQIATRAAAFAATKKEEKLGVFLESAFVHPRSTESPLANFMTDALRETIDADIAIHNVLGGIRNGLPEGDLTFGAVYEMFPFDNRVVVLDLSGLELRKIITKQAHNHGRRAGFSGMRVFVSCADDKMDVVMQLDDGKTITDDSRVTLIANDFLAFGGDDILTPVMPEGGFDVDDSLPLTRDVLIEWFRAKGGSLKPANYESTDSPRWNLPSDLPDSCKA